MCSVHSKIVSIKSINVIYVDFQQNYYWHLIIYVYRGGIFLATGIIIHEFFNLISSIRNWNIWILDVNQSNKNSIETMIMRSTDNAGGLNISTYFFRKKKKHVKQFFVTNANARLSDKCKHFVRFWFWAAHFFLMHFFDNFRIFFTKFWTSMQIFFISKKPELKFLIIIKKCLNMKYSFEIVFNHVIWSDWMRTLIVIILFKWYIVISREKQNQRVLVIIESSVRTTVNVKIV